MIMNQQSNFMIMARCARPASEILFTAKLDARFSPCPLSTCDTWYQSKTALSPKNPAKAPPLSLPEKQCSAFHNNTFKCNKSLY